MRLLRWMICIPVAMAAVMGADATATKSLAARSSTTASTSTSTSSTSEVAFLQLLQTAQINWMACLITLVNMTYNDIGTCLGLSTLATARRLPFEQPVVLRPAGQLPHDNVRGDRMHLDGYCRRAKPAGKHLLRDDTDGLGDGVEPDPGSVHGQLSNARLLGILVSAPSRVSLTSSNSTGELCLPSTLNTSSIANSNSFFNNLVSGTNLSNYQDSVFTSAQCTGCMYEIYKSA
jgi:hypothetical protein